MVTSNGVGAGHLIRSSAIAREFSNSIRPIVLSMAYSVVEVCSALGLECEYVPSRDKKLMPKRKWDQYLKNRIVALIDETGASVLTFDGVVPYPGIVAAKFARPHISLIWIRRGMWQRKPQGVLLGLQSKLMDYVIEPGDIARDADFGPTKRRKESTLMSPVTLFREERALTRESARKLLNLDLDKPAVLIQLGVGSSDLDSRVSAVLRGISGWEDVQIVMGRPPVDEMGNSLAPLGTQVKVIRHFPLADLLHAFDAAICAAGYNSVHELLPARVPTLLLSNDRGTDDQTARARWCAENGLTLYANNEVLEDIEIQASKLKDQTTRNFLMRNCSNLPLFQGGEEIAKVIESLNDAKVNELVYKRIYFQRIIAVAAFARSPRFYFKRILNLVLRTISLMFRFFKPHNSLQVAKGEVVFSGSTNFRALDEYIRNSERFEHLISNPSKLYISQRQKIARMTYGDLDFVPLNSQLEVETHFKLSS